MVENRSPHNPQSEAAIIAACLSSKELTDHVVSSISKSDFFCHDTGKIFSAIVASTESGATYSMVGVAERANLELDEVRAVRDKYGLPTQEELDGYIRDVKQAAQKRRVIQACQDAILACSRPHSKLDAVLEGLEKQTYSVSSQVTSELVDSSDSFRTAVKGIIERRTHGLVHVPQTPLKALNRAILGWFPGKLYLIGARPGMGKSALWQDASDHILETDQSAGIVTFSLEMPAEEVAERSISKRASVNLRSITSGKGITDEEMNRICAIPDQAGVGRWFIDDKCRSIQEITRKARIAASKMLRNGVQLKLVIVDYIQLASGDEEGSVSKVSRGLKLLAMELDCAVIGLTQLNRGVEHRDDKRPGLSDIRGENGGGALEQDADCVIFVYREAYYSPVSDENSPHVAELIVAKQRSGPTGSVKVQYNPKLVRFEDLNEQDLRHGPSNAGGPGGEGLDLDSLPFVPSSSSPLQ